MRFIISRASPRFRYPLLSLQRHWRASRSARSICSRRCGVSEEESAFTTPVLPSALVILERGAANEETAFRPKSPYGVAKAAAISLVANYRESYGLFACSGLLFNHESPLRPSRFVTRKITAAVARISAGRRARLALRNFHIRRAWG